MACITIGGVMMKRKPKNWTKDEWDEYQYTHKEVALTKPEGYGLKGGVPGDIDIHGQTKEGKQYEKGPGPAKGEIDQKSVSRWLRGLPMPSMKRERAWRIINVILDHGWVGIPPMNNLNSWKIWTDKKDPIGIDRKTGKPVYRTHVVWKERAISKIPEEVKATGLYMVKRYDRMYPAWKVNK